MRDLPESIHGAAAHPLGGGIGGSVFRVLLLQVHQVVDQSVVLKILQLRCIQIVVQVHMMLDLFLKLLHLLPDLFAHLHTSPI